MWIAEQKKCKYSKYSCSQKYAWLIVDMNAMVIWVF